MRLSRFGHGRKQPLFALSCGAGLVYGEVMKLMVPKISFMTALVAVPPVIAALETHPEADEPPHIHYEMDLQQFNMVSYVAVTSTSMTRNVFVQDSFIMADASELSTDITPGS